ncbi:hypothetical protein DUGA6_01030 [Duganella sp. HH105]|nr:hypothetical protein DUGA6_01030 [Duganella sp. HH105]
MAAWLKTLMMAILAFGGSWLGAVWYWRANNRMPATDDLVLCLLVLPLALLAVFWLGRKIYRGISAPAASASGGAAAQAEVPAEPARGPALSLVAAAVRAPHGMSAAELGAALAGAQARPALDSELNDDQGYPIMSARIADIDPDPLREEVSEWLAAHDLEPHFSDEQWRALSAGSEVVSELSSPLSGHPQLAAHAERLARREPSPLPVLQLQPVWQAEWKPEQRQAAALWLRHMLTQAGWPEERIAVAPERGAADTEVTTALARLLSDEPPALTLVVACGSHIGADSVERLGSAAALFNASHPQGQIPGEGAAGLLLADAAQAAMLAPGQQLPQLLAVNSGRLAHSADESKRASAELLLELSTKALHSAGREASAIALITADTDHRTSRVMELMGVMSETTPQLDPGADVFSVGAGCGSCGAVTYLTALALARQEAESRNAAILCISNLDPFRRDVAVIGPAAPVAV